MRFWNNDVLTNITGVLEVIANALAEAPPHPDR
jgi:very-short-patch-repair endonuclease